MESVVEQPASDPLTLTLMTCVMCGKCLTYLPASVTPGFYDRLVAQAEAAGWQMAERGPVCPDHSTA